MYTDNPTIHDHVVKTNKHLYIYIVYLYSIRFNNYSLPVTSGLTIGLPYKCSGNEGSLMECQHIGTICNVLNNNHSDIVAVTCTQVTMSSSYKLF